MVDDLTIQSDFVIQVVRFPQLRLVGAKRGQPMIDMEFQKSKLHYQAPYRLVKIAVVALDHLRYGFWTFHYRAHTDEKRNEPMKRMLQDAAPLPHTIARRLQRVRPKEMRPLS
ncbi:MAG: hypothetical protein EOS07_27385 [Mesorhizobium sp.]|uniref:hypothetical protein n=1 Tax=Mesorhizobium sp. TaxID=1871066 RepID=UPI000FE3C7DE|nr:hypothetical protein [Mesorhizobium sp.]RWC02229.1 MAG: hypothetical protein EOQ56_10170 [Mesorhizobium sp.]RWO04815.1 MAG: hypothetical protein EOS07_27385 [Mesorhizobium sp.]RWO19042.1 MAG: hypothetical protein EOS08_23535 [Mesorhizobium sp.]RWO96328.1 MAG: hypothetical protein EOQ99_33270 [Mesorhizobium sp.]RWP57338.1 MAG: hypothetical protein EOR07_31425 [Mesorhizobium sp.]